MLEEAELKKHSVMEMVRIRIEDIRVHMADASDMAIQMLMCQKTVGILVEN